MADIPEKLVPGLNSVLNFSSHPVERITQFSQFILFLDFNPVAQIAFGNGINAASQDFNGFENSAYPPTGQCNHQGNGKQEEEDCPFMKVAPFSKIITESDTPALINIGCGEDQTIKELAELVKQIVGFEKPLHFDTSKPDGSPRKLLDVSKIHALGWRHHTSLFDGIKITYSDFLERKIS